MSNKIILSANGRFYFFELAIQLNKRGKLLYLICPYPPFLVKRYGLEPKKVKGIPIVEIFKRLFCKMPFPIYEIGEQLVCLLFDKLQIFYINKKANLFIGLSSCQYSALKIYKNIGIPTIIDIGSPHPIKIKNQYDKEISILKDRFKLKDFDLNKDIVFEATKELTVKKGLSNLLQREYKIADYINVPSSNVKESMIENGIDAKKILVNHYGVCLETFYPMKKNDNYFKLVYAGGITFRKGVHYLIKAFLELNLPDSKLFLAGNISNSFRKYLKFNKSKNIKLLGHLTESNLNKLYNNSSIFVHPSLSEGLSLVALQALATSTPIICTNMTGAQDLITNNIHGYIINTHNLDQLKEKILKIYNDKKLLNYMRDNLVSLDIKKYSWDSYGSRAIKIADKVIKYHNN